MTEAKTYVSWAPWVHREDYLVIRNQPDDSWKQGNAGPLVQGLSHWPLMANRIESFAVRLEELPMNVIDPERMAIALTVGRQKGMDS